LVFMAVTPPHADTPNSPPRTLLLTPSPTRQLPKDQAGYLVLTPNPRAASALGVPPRSLDSTARRILREGGLMMAGELARHHALRRAIRDTLESNDPDGVARSMTPCLRELLRAGLDAELREGTISERAHQVLRVAHRYRQLLRANHQVDPAEVLWQAASLATIRSKILVYGYPRLGHDESAFLDAFAAPGSLVLMQEGDAEAETELAARGWVVESASESPTSLGDRLASRMQASSDSRIPELRGLRFPTQESEVRYVLSEVKTLLHAGVSAQDMVLIVRDERAYGPLLKAIAWEYQIPLRATYALPLTDSRLGAWLLTLTEVIWNDAPFEATARLLSHPQAGGLPADMWATARKEHPRGIGRWSELDPRVAQLAWPRRDQRGKYRARLDAALQDFGVAARARKPADMLALSRLQTALSDLSEPAAEIVRRNTFLTELQELIACLELPADVGIHGVELHTPLAVYGARYQHVFVLGAAENVLPAPVRDDPVLDFFERDALRRAGLPLESAAQAAHREKRSFEAMLRTAQSTLTLTYPEVLAARSRIASPYFTALGVEPTSPPDTPLASIEEARRVLLQQNAECDSVLDAARHAWMVERQRESEAPCGAFDGVIGLPLDPGARTFSASQLVTLGQCPFKWFAQRLLKLAEPQEAEEQVSPVLRGRIWHKTLERALAAAQGAHDTRATALAALEDAFTEAECSEGTPDTPTWPILRREHLQELRRAISADDFLPAGAEVVAIEQHFEAPWRGLRVQGVVDRIDRTQDGLRLLDYKTRGSKPAGAQDANGKASIDIQLPLYVEAASPCLFPGEAVAEARYYSLTKAEALPPVKRDEEALDGLVDRIRRHLQAGSYPVAPDIDGVACATCDYDLLCRRGPRLERKRQEGQP
ncbi:MAG TPA: PD-(D/E)XK nuclease family protein, partial [Trueperaceae bacterium]